MRTRNGNSGALRTALITAFAALMVAQAPVELFAASRARKRPVVRSVGVEQVRSWYVIERADTDLGAILPGESRLVEGALVIRVFSETDWMLRLHADSVTIGSQTQAHMIPSDRLATRSNRGPWEPLAGSLPAIVAKGGPTSGGGELVVIDLRLDLEQTDPVGTLDTRFEIVLEPM